MIYHLAVFFTAFVGVWVGAGITISNVDKLSKKLVLSSFATSFFILGILTSVPEFALGVNAILDKNPQLFVGNLIGGQMVLFLFVIPLLAIVGKGVALVNQLKGRGLLLSLVVTALPAVIIINRRVDWVEGLFLIIIYIVLFFVIEKKKSFFEDLNHRFSHQGNSIFIHFIKILAGILLVFVSSKFIVDQTIYFSYLLNISSYIMGLLILSIGTNLPELSLTFRAVRLGKKEIAFGDYIGSSAANTLIFGILVLFNKAPIHLSNHFFLTLFFMLGGLTMFFYFIRSRNMLSYKEGIILLFVYILFVVLEILVSAI